MKYIVYLQDIGLHFRVFFPERHLIKYLMQIINKIKKI